MFTNLLYILLAIVMLGVIVTVHEFGHYLVGRLCGIGIVEFSVGFGPRLLGWEDGVLSVSAYRCLLRISAETGEELGRLDTTGKGVLVIHDGWYYATRRPEGQEEERCLELLRLNAAGEEQVYGTVPVSGSWELSERIVFGRRGFLYFADPDIEHYADGADGYWYFPYEGGEPRRVYAGSSKLKTQN